MAGQPKRGLDFAAWDVHLFDDDERFDVLIDAQGWDGFGVFFGFVPKLMQQMVTIMSGEKKPVLPR